MWGDGFVGGGGRGGAGGDGGGVGDEDGMWGEGFGGEGNQGEAAGGGGGGRRGGGGRQSRDAEVKNDANARQHPHSYHPEGKEELSGGLPSPRRGVDGEGDGDDLWDDEDAGWSR